MHWERKIGLYRLCTFYIYMCTFHETNISTFSASPPSVTQILISTGWISHWSFIHIHKLDEGKAKPRVKRRRFLIENYDTKKYIYIQTFKVHVGFLKQDVENEVVIFWDKSWSIICVEWKPHTNKQTDMYTFRWKRSITSVLIVAMGSWNQSPYMTDKHRHFVIRSIRVCLIFSGGAMTAPPVFISWKVVICQTSNSWASVCVLWDHRMLSRNFINENIILSTHGWICPWSCSLFIFSSSWWVSDDFCPLSRSESRTADPQQCCSLCCMKFCMEASGWNMTYLEQQQGHRQ